MNDNHKKHVNEKKMFKKLYIRKNSLVSLFNGISNFVGYLMLNISL